MNPFISICIPAYKNAAYLDVLLHSIELQGFSDYEVIVSDDSPNDEVEILCRKYSSKFLMIYHKNSPPKGSPANWNTGIKMANGKWIKLMHDDDWFSSDTSLADFAKAAQENAHSLLIFSGYSLYEDGVFKSNNIITALIENQLRRSPLILFKKNYIGHPSTTLIKNEPMEWYDEKVKWVVDFEFYIRMLKNGSFHSIQLPLVNIGIGNEQITKEAFRNISIEIPENMYLLNKLGTPVLKNIIVYDYYWRLLRNVGIRSLKDITDHYSEREVPPEISRMLRFQLLFPLPVLKVGFFSKLLMSGSYLYNFFAGKHMLIKLWILVK